MVSRIRLNLCALVAELVDAADSKSVVRKDVGVRFSPRAPKHTKPLKGFYEIPQRAPLQKAYEAATALEPAISQALANLSSGDKSISA